MAALLVLLLLLAVPPTAFTTTDVYYVTAHDAAGHEQSCSPHQICHNLSYYISQPDSYFTNDTTIIFLEGEHSFEREDSVHVSNVHNLTLKGQGQWPVAGAEETVMQSTVIINCTRGRGGFYFTTSHNITVEGLTVVNCGGVTINAAVFNFDTVHSLFFQKNSMQYMTGLALCVHNCDNVIVTNCSYYHSAVCNFSDSSESYNGGVGIVYYTQYSNTGYTLELSHSNMTRCCTSSIGGGLLLGTLNEFGKAKVVFDYLKLSHNKAGSGASTVRGSITAILNGNGNMTLVISNSVFFNGSGGGIELFVTIPLAAITIENTDFVENGNSEMFIIIQTDIRTLWPNVTFSMVNSTVHHTYLAAEYGVLVTTEGCCISVRFINTSMTFANIRNVGFKQHGTIEYSSMIQMDSCQFIGSFGVPSIVYLNQIDEVVITNCIFSNNTSDANSRSVVILHKVSETIIQSCIVSDNNMTGITLIETSAIFSGHNVIQNNRNTEGAGITLFLPAYIVLDGELLLYNNTADKHGGAILVKQQSFSIIELQSSLCTLSIETLSSSVTFSGNRAGKGGSDMYGAILMGCYNTFGPQVGYGLYMPHVGHPNETSWYLKTFLITIFNFSNTDRLSSMSSDPIMICFCNTSNLPDCSDRTHHIQTYPGLEINTSIATVGYYGGTSPGVVLVSAQHATLVRYYGQNETTNCFLLHILLQNTSSTTALVDIRLKNVVQGLAVSIGVDILECPIGFTEISGQCHCDHFLANSNVQCTFSASPFKFLRSGNSWFAYNNNTQCITGTTNCPFDYCNRSNVSFDIMGPDRQCVANRVGILCGQCQSHLSIMLGSNHCGTCSNWYIFLLPVFALTGIVLVAVLMFLNLSVPVGTINGLLFYVNMVKLNEVFFFPNGSVPVVSQFISWLNLDLGIEVCLFDGLDGYWNTWLQFAFPAYLFLIMGGIIVGCRYSVWLCRLCGSHAVPALATLFLMSYTKILLTVTNALSMSWLPCNDSILTVWSLDGNIEYGSVKHLILVVFSCGVLVVGLAYPVLVLCAPLLERYSHKCIPLHRWNPVAKLKPLLDAYGGPYKDKYRFWTGVTLMVRLTVTVTFSFTSGRSVVINASIITTVVVGILTFWSFTDGIYKNIYLSTLEAFYLLNIFLLSTVSLATASLGSRDYQIATIVSVCLSFVVCLVTMAMHLWWNFDLKKIKRRLGFKDRPEYIPVAQAAVDEDDEEDRPPPGSPPSIVYGSRRGEHQFVLEFPHPHEELESSSPVLLAREPLLFDT